MSESRAQLHDSSLVLPRVHLYRLLRPVSRGFSVYKGFIHASLHSVHTKNTLSWVRGCIINSFWLQLLFSANNGAGCAGTYACKCVYTCVCTFSARLSHMPIQGRCYDVHSLIPLIWRPSHSVCASMTCTHTHTHVRHTRTNAQCYFYRTFTQPDCFQYHLNFFHSFCLCWHQRCRHRQRQLRFCHLFLIRYSDAKIIQVHVELVYLLM